ncbi:hypothetical protein NQ038_00080 [Brevibacterium sp. 50QC2O2]|uniref:hypothetical protein n=1 Tax=Brevibacterium sp. 50QC2O2 TaxID=2968459 RepID=UPI00211C2930|nr:hypothetical protein [Brevibacterium sp. 50QC2O2]MCQ9387060.1 hypothetical protein [Brevibacterium sp. 50QC2O2]
MSEPAPDVTPPGSAPVPDPAWSWKLHDSRGASSICTMLVLLGAVVVWIAALSHDTTGWVLAPVLGAGAAVIVALRARNLWLLAWAIVAILSPAYYLPLAGGMN